MLFLTDVKSSSYAVSVVVGTGLILENRQI